MKHPRIYTTTFVKQWNTQTISAFGYIPARPMQTRTTLYYRLKLAWGVFTGKYDALSWMDDQ